MSSTLYMSEKGKPWIISRNDRLNIHLPMSWFADGTKIRFALGLPDTEENCAKANRIIQRILLDYEEGKLPGSKDEIVRKYSPKQTLTLVSSINTPKVSLAELMDRFLQFKALSVKEKTVKSTYNPIRSVINRCETDGLLNPESFCQELVEITSIKYVKLTLMYSSAACEWGMKQGIVHKDPFRGLHKDFKIPDPKPAIAFTTKERDRIIQHFQKEHEGEWNGKTHVRINYSYYTPFVKFLFFTGCRPSEAIGLRWKYVSEDCGFVQFVETIVEQNGKFIYNSTDKTDARRIFPCSPKLRAFLLEYRPMNAEPEDLVFPAPKNPKMPINATNFGDGGWRFILTDLDLYEKEHHDTKEMIRMTLYCTRNSFATWQLAAGVAEERLARWMGNSPEIIRKKYVDHHMLARISELRPIEV